MPVKRKQVPSACVACRNRKTKCDGERPCGPCVERRVNCVYTTHENETQRQTDQRRYSEVERAYSENAEVIRLMIEKDEGDAYRLFQRLRSREPVHAILSRPVLHGHLATLHERRLRRDFLIFISQSTGSLQEIVRISRIILTRGSHAALPHNDIYRPLRNRISCLETLVGVLNLSHRDVGSSSSDYLPPHLPPYGALHGISLSPLHAVSAQPWTYLAANDTVSHLVSLFLTLINPYWRLVEEDLFLVAMRSGNLQSSFCNPFLVHAIMSCASIYSEIDEIFETPTDYLTRGTRFHDEAMRLLPTERDRATIANMQALTILSLCLQLRGKDKLGMGTLASAAVLMKIVSPVAKPSCTPIESANYTRAYQCAASTVVWMNLSTSLELLLPSCALEVSVQDMFNFRQTLPQTSVPWVGYPLGVASIPLPVNELLSQREVLTRLIWDLIALGSRVHTPENVDSLLDDARSLTARLYKWHDDLPNELRCNPRAPLVIFELQAQFNCTTMLLYDKVFDRLREPVSQLTNLKAKSDLVDTFREDIRTAKLQHCHETAKCLSIFRQVYGHKITTPFLFRQASIAAFILLKDAHEQSTPRSSCPESSKDTPDRLTIDGTTPPINSEQHQQQQKQQPHGIAHSSTPPSSSASATCEASLEECFRCLFGSGVQVPMARGILRMLVHTAREFSVSLPSTVEEFLRLLEDTAWHSSDIRHYSSIYPNHALIDSFEDAEDKRIESLLRKWEKIDFGVGSDDGGGTSGGGRAV